MIYAAKIILFMKYKKQALEKEARRLYVEDIPNYFTEYDKQAILRWSVWKTKRIWNTLYHNIKYNPGFSTMSCPFCNYLSSAGLRSELDGEGSFVGYKVCKQCPYGAKHGRCVHPDSDFTDWSYLLGLLKNPVITVQEYMEIIMKVEKLSGKYAKTLKLKYKTG